MEIQQFLDFIDATPNAFYAIKNVKEVLQENSYKELKMGSKWQLEKGGQYFVTVNDTSCIAFSINDTEVEECGFKIIASHTDQPSLRIKPQPEIESQGYLKLNVEVYGGPILNTWLDRPLSIAGRVVLRAENVRQPEVKLVNFDEPLLTIPNLAIHMNREVNKGVELNKQVDMLPIVGQISEELTKEDCLMNLIAKQLEVSKEDIIDFDLFLYAYEKSALIGINKDFISAPRIDDLSMVFASLQGFLQSENKKGVNVFAAMDNEEIGSRTAQGADSPTLSYVLERIALALGKDREAFLQSIYNSFMISADVAHGVHPNKAEKHDPVIKPTLNKGPVIKLSSNQRYITESPNVAVYEEICRLAEVPYQKFVNRSDAVGGSTLGPISASHLPMQIIDMGPAMLAMHSARELMGAKDMAYIQKSFKEFYNM